MQQEDYSPFHAAGSKPLYPQISFLLSFFPWQDGATSLIIAAAQSRQITNTVMETKQVTETIMAPQQVTKTIQVPKQVVDGSIPVPCLESKQVTETIMVPQQVTKTIQVPRQVFTQIGHEAMVRLLLKHHADPNEAKQVCNNKQGLQ